MKMKWIRKMKAIMLVILTIGLLTACAGGTAGSRKSSSADIGGESSNTTMDVVMMMDESGSMVKADESRIAIEGAKLFVDMEKTTGVNLALVEFSNQVMSTGLVDMEDADNRSSMQNMLEGITYSGRAHTDTGAGLLKAEEILDEAPESDHKVIILFTDGRTDIDVGTPGRTTEDSQNDVDLAVQQAQEKGYKIYCIGLNADGTVDENELSTIALSTSGKYHIANDVNELPEFFNSIFADINSVDPMALDEYDADGDYRNVQFDIPEQTVMEANVVILSHAQVEDVQLVSPDGETVDIQNDSRVRFTTSKTYSLVKLIYPEAGTWSISVKGVEGDHIKVSLICNYDISLQINVDATVLRKGEVTGITARLYTGSEALDAPELYETMSGYISVSNESGEELEQIELKNGSQDMYGSFSLDEYGKYNVQVHVSGDGFYRDSEIFQIEVASDSTEVVKKITTIKVTEGGQKSIDLNNYFEDPNENGLTYSIEEDDNDCISTEVLLSTLTVTGKKAGKTTINVLADNGSSIKIYQRVDVVCRTKVAAVLGTMLPLIAILLLAGIFWILIRGKMRLSGNFKEITITDVRMTEAGTPETVTYRILSEVPAQAIGKHSGTVGKLLKVLDSYYQCAGHDEANVKEFENCIKEFATAANGIKICGSKKPFTLIFKNNNANVIMKKNYVSEDKVMMVALNKQDYTGISTGEAKIEIEFKRTDETSMQIGMTYKRM